MAVTAGGLGKVQELAGGDRPLHLVLGVEACGHEEQPQEAEWQL